MQLKSAAISPSHITNTQPSSAKVSSPQLWLCVLHITVTHCQSLQIHSLRLLKSLVHSYGYACYIFLSPIASHITNTQPSSAKVSGPQLWLCLLHLTCHPLPVITNTQPSSAKVSGPQLWLCLLHLTVTHCQSLQTHSPSSAKVSGPQLWLCVLPPRWLNGKALASRARDPGTAHTTFSRSGHTQRV